MKIRNYLRNGICGAAAAATLVAAPAPTASAEEKSIEAETHVHRLASTNRSPYDAFTYVNRIPEEPGDQETPIELSGRIFGRLGNQEGRILLKLPPGMTKQDYLSFKTFFRYEGAQAGNCAACHTPRNFDGADARITAKGGEAKAAPSLRNLGERDDLADIIRSKIAAAAQKQGGEAGEIDDAYAPMNITEEDVEGLVGFLNLLNDGPEEDFRKLILNAEILDTSFLFR